MQLMEVNRLGYSVWVPYDLNCTSSEKNATPPSLKASPELRLKNKVNRMRDSRIQ